MDTTPDFWDIEYKYQSPVLLAKATGVLSGMDSAGTFGGSGNLSRAQAAVVLGKLNDLRNTGDGSAVNPNLPEPTTPAEITRSPFAFQDNENVQQMMNRLNAEAPKYYEGYLTNGKPITEENIQAMLAEAEKGMPSKTKWDTSNFYKYGTKALSGYTIHYACGAYAGALSDYIFGKDAPVTRHQNFEDIKIGDVIWIKDSSIGDAHAVFVTALHTSSVDSYEYTDGNNGGRVWWGWQDYVGDWRATKKIETYVYSRY